MLNFKGVFERAFFVACGALGAYVYYKINEKEKQHVASGDCSILSNPDQSLNEDVSSDNASTSECTTNTRRDTTILVHESISQQLHYENPGTSRPRKPEAEETEDLLIPRYLFLLPEEVDDDDDTSHSLSDRNLWSINTSDMTDTSYSRRNPPVASSPGYYSDTDSSSSVQYPVVVYVPGPSNTPEYQYDYESGSEFNEADNPDEDLSNTGDDISTDYSDSSISLAPLYSEKTFFK
jgi:hypothetical protein